MDLNGFDELKLDDAWLGNSNTVPKLSLLFDEAGLVLLNAEFIVSGKYPLAVCNESGLVGVGGSSNGVCSISSDGLYGVTIWRGTWLYCIDKSIIGCNRNHNSKTYTLYIRHKCNVTKVSSI